MSTDRSADIHIRVQAEDFDSQTIIETMTKGRKDIGALATFTGLCRSEGESLSALELEHYPGMAERELERVAMKAGVRWPVDGLTIIHRYGRIAPGEQIVFVAATSRHRDAAFDAARYVMDFLKTDAPFWKKEHKADGSSGAWVDARDKDDAAKERWNED